MWGDWGIRCSKSPRQRKRLFEPVLLPGEYSPFSCSPHTTSSPSFKMSSLWHRGSLLGASTPCQPGLATSSRLSWWWCLSCFVSFSMLFFVPRKVQVQRNVFYGCDLDQWVLPSSFPRCQHRSTPTAEVLSGMAHVVLFRRPGLLLKPTRSRHRAPPSAPQQHVPSPKPRHNGETCGQVLPCKSCLCSQQRAGLICAVGAGRWAIAWPWQWCCQSHWAREAFLLTWAWFLGKTDRRF